MVSGLLTWNYSVNVEEFNVQHGLNTEFLTYTGCVQTGKKYFKGLDIDVQRRLNNSSNLRKSITVTCKVHNETKIYYDILVET